LVFDSLAAYKTSSSAALAHNSLVVPCMRARFVHPEREPSAGFGETSAGSKIPVMDDHLDNPRLIRSRDRQRGSESNKPAETQVVSTTDSFITLAAEYQPDWRRHPEATTNLTTVEMSEPVSLALLIPEMTAIQRMLHGPSVGEQRTPDEGTSAGQFQELSGKDRKQERPPKLPHAPAMKPAPPSARYPAWLIVTCALVGGLVGVAVCLRMIKGFSHFASRGTAKRKPLGHGIRKT
jgi:hypothetical protein